MGLSEYRQKRHFTRTSEPKGKRGRTAARSRTFVIQKHAARRLHYDFRLELDGVLKSWAVPKGPSLNPAEKRLAVEVEDHPLEYAKFEGRIPEGEYGAGEVIVWDRGTWKSADDPVRGLRAGKLEFELTGKKLSGGWRLVRMGRPSRESPKPQWLLMKRSDDAARLAGKAEIVEERPESVKTGRTLPLADNPKRTKPKPRSRRKRTTAAARSNKSRAKSKPQGGKLATMPRGIAPQLATLVQSPPTGAEWLHEVKFDGYRLIAYVQNGSVELRTRTQQNWTERYPKIAEGLSELPVDTAILDGEVVALLPSGISSFQALQNAMRNKTQANLAYYVFDLLYWNGHDLRTTPLGERKKLLAELLANFPRPQIRLSEHADISGPELFEASCRMGLEGIISKRADRPYVSGRSADWTKCKCLGREELVIGGFTPSTASDREFGALLVGYFAADKLVYAGRVGTGFTAASLREIHNKLAALVQDDCPFAELPDRERGERTTWVRPNLVAELEFTGWTEGEVMRHPSFQGLREDKPARSISRPASLPGKPKAAKATKRAAAKSNRLARPAKKQTRRKSKHSPSIELPDNISIRLTSPERVIFPDTGLTKLGLAAYYAQVAEWILPHLAQRPLSLVRCPDGQAGPCFFQKHAATGTPDELGRIMIKEKSESEEYLFVRDVEGLVSLAQISALEIHVWGSRCDQVERPDRIVMDLDPHESVEWADVIAAAREVRDLLEEQGLASFVKTTGGKGLHVVVPLAPRRHDWDRVKEFAHSIADALVERSPDRYTANMSKAARRGKIFVDYLRNGRGATAIVPYSPRARPGAPVAAPLRWNELKPNLKSNHFTVGNILDRLRSLSRDPWEEIDSIQQTLPS
jgi:bifunctional non-homologous end joining protein LigD